MVESHLWSVPVDIDGGILWLLRRMGNDGLVQRLLGRFRGLPRVLVNIRGVNHGRLADVVGGVFRVVEEGWIADRDVGLWTWL